MNRDLLGKRLLLLEGSALTKLIVEKAHSLGIYVVIANWYSTEDAPAKAFADKAYTVNIFDVPAMMDIIQAEKIDGIFTAYTDSHLHIYEQLCREANLPCFTTSDLVDVMVDKALFKARCLEVGLPVIDEYSVERILNEETYRNSVSFPVIVKPVDNSGARGISVCYDESSLIKAIERGLSFSSSKHVIVEKYLRMEIPGDGYCLADFFIQDGNAYYCCSSDKPANDDIKNQVNLPGAYIYPSQKDLLIRETLEQKVQNFIDLIGYKNGVLCFELICSGGKVYIIEAQFRYGAKFQEVFLEQEYGFDEATMLLGNALSVDTKVQYQNALDSMRHKPFNRCYALMNILLHAGKIFKIPNEQDVLHFPNVDCYVPMLNIGADIKPDGSMVQCFGKVSFSAPDREALLKSMRFFQRHIRILDENGENMVIPSVTI